MFCFLFSLMGKKEHGSKRPKINPGYTYLCRSKKGTEQKRGWGAAVNEKSKRGEGKALEKPCAGQ